MTESLFTATVPVFKVDGQVHGELARDLLRLEIAEDSTGQAMSTTTGVNTQ